MEMAWPSVLQLSKVHKNVMKARGSRQMNGIKCHHLIIEFIKAFVISPLENALVQNVIALLLFIL